MKVFVKNLFRLLTATALLLPLTGNASCGFFDKKIRFADGSTACLNEISFLNTKGLMRTIPNESYASKAKSHSSYAIAVTAEPLLCPFEQSMQWDWSGDDGKRAVSACESRMAAAEQALGKSARARACHCEVIVESGTTKFTRAEFEQRAKLYERQLALGRKPIEVAEAQIKEQTDRELNAQRQAEVLALAQKLEIERMAAARERAQREDEKLVAMRERAQREEAERKKKELPQVFAMRRALVIGNDSYKYADPLKNAREDAKAIASELRGFGYEVTLHLDQTQKGMQAALRNFRDKVNAGDEVLFFFSGHAVEIDGKNFLTPVDAIGNNASQLADDSIDLKSSVLDPLTMKKVKLTLALIDACRDNPFMKTATRSIVTRGLAPTTPATGQLIVYSAGSGQTALDRLGPSDADNNGVFTRVLLAEMRKPNVPIHQVIRNVRSEVVKLARSIGHEQVPAIYDQVDGDFYFKK